MSDEIELYVAVVEDKQMDDYDGKYCHPNMHPKNYVIKGKYTVKPQEIALLEAFDEGAISRAQRNLRNQGIYGRVQLRQHNGGPGRKGRYETRVQWSSKRASGLRKIVEFDVN